MPQSYYTSRWPVALAGMLLLSGAVTAQEIEPRRWGHLPVDSFYLGAGYAYTEMDILDDPVKGIQDGRARIHNFAVKGIYSFKLFGRTARAEAALPYTEGTWTGLLSGESNRADRSGFADPVIRLAVNLVGAPPLKGEEYLAYHRGRESDTVVGVALALHVPAGEYMEDKLINLGQNRWVFRPQAGVMHRRGNWTGELSASIRCYTDDRDYLNGTRETRPYYAVQAHLIYSIRQGLWTSASSAYGRGGENTVAGVSQDDEREAWVNALSLGFSLNPVTSAKLSAVSSRSQNRIGSDSGTVMLSLSRLW